MRDAVNAHRGGKIGVMHLNAGHALRLHESQPFAVNRQAIL